VVEAGDSFELREPDAAYKTDLAGKSAGLRVENTHFLEQLSRHIRNLITSDPRPRHVPHAGVSRSKSNGFDTTPHLVPAYPYRVSSF
jgi:hypothetical protein